VRSRSSSSPKRKIVAFGSTPKVKLELLQVRAYYLGSGHHKRSPADYGFERTSPRPTKSLCDASRVILRNEAQQLLGAGIAKEMISEIGDDGFPKYIWSVSSNEEIFESKTHPNGTGQYHGYPLGPEDDWREVVLKAWMER
jgi:hypothetical protein